MSKAIVKSQNYFISFFKFIKSIINGDNDEDLLSILGRAPSKTQNYLLTFDLTTKSIISHLAFIFLVIVIANILIETVPWHKLAIKNRILQSFLHYSSFLFFIFGWCTCAFVLIEKRYLSAFIFSNISAFILEILFFGTICMIFSILLFTFLSFIQLNRKFVGVYAFLSALFPILATYQIHLKLFHIPFVVNIVIVVFLISLLLFYLFYHAVFKLFREKSRILKKAKKFSINFYLLIFMTVCVEYFFYSFGIFLISSNGILEGISNAIETANSGLAGNVWKYGMVLFFTSWASSIVKGFNTVYISSVLSDFSSIDTKSPKKWLHSITHSFRCLPEIAYNTLIPELFQLSTFILTFALNILECMEAYQGLKLIITVGKLLRAYFCALLFIFNCKNSMNFAISTYDKMNAESLQTDNQKKKAQSVFPMKSKFIVKISNLTNFSSIVFQKYRFMFLPLLYISLERYIAFKIRKYIFILYIFSMIASHFGNLFSTVAVIESYDANVSIKN